MEERKTPEPIKEYFIAYFDILGYKEFFKNTPEKAEEFLKCINDGIFNSKNLLNSMGDSQLVQEALNRKFHIKAFSDNVVICVEDKNDKWDIISLLMLMMAMADIQRGFIFEYGLFIRGGITKGKISFNEDYIFGKGLIDAVQLEESAVHPRIVVSDEILSSEKLDFYEANLRQVGIENMFLFVKDNLLINDLVDSKTIVNYLYYINPEKFLGEFDPSIISEIIKKLKDVYPSDYKRVETGIKATNIKSHQEKLLLHKDRLVEKVKIYGNYNDIPIENDKDAELREKILKKYIWAINFHNNICQIYHLENCCLRINSSFDVRFLRLTAQVEDGVPID